MKASSVFAASVAVATGLPLGMAMFGIGMPAEPVVGFYSSQESIVLDPSGDAEPIIQQSNSSVVPEVRGYHDILAAKVKKNGESFNLRIDLAGNPNLNEKFETNYMWHLVSSDFLGQERGYLVMIINFAPDFNHTLQGWHYAIFDTDSDTYVIPQTELGGEMPADGVEFIVPESLIGNPSSFQYWVSIYSRVDNSSFAGPPEYLMDHAP